MNEKLDQNLEDVRTEELVANVDSDLVEVKETTTKKIKDYLSKDLFNGIKIISGKESDEEVNSLAKSDLSEYEKTFKDISENQIISAKVIGISENDIMVDIGFKSEGLINRSEFNNKDLPEIGSKIDIFLEKLEGVSEPEKKRKVIGEQFIRSFEDATQNIQDISFLPALT